MTDTKDKTPPDGQPVLPPGLPKNIPPEMLRRMQSQAQPPRPMPHPAQVSLTDYLQARWALIKGTVALDVAEVLGISHPNVQQYFTQLWTAQYWEVRAAALEVGIQGALRRAAVMQNAFEMAVIVEDERKYYLDSAEESAPKQFDRLPE